MLIGLQEEPIADSFSLTLSSEATFHEGMSNLSPAWKECDMASLGHAQLHGLACNLDSPILAESNTADGAS